MALKNLTKGILRLAAIVSAATALMTPPDPAWAAGNGQLGGTSSGSIALRVFIPNSFRINGVRGITVDEFDGPQISNDGRICIQTNMAEAYTIQATFKMGRFALIDAASRDAAPFPPAATPAAYASPSPANADTPAAFCQTGTVLAIKSEDGGPRDPSAAFLKTGTVIMTVVPE